MSSTSFSSTWLPAKTIVVFQRRLTSLTLPLKRLITAKSENRTCLPVHSIVQNAADGEFPARLVPEQQLSALMNTRNWVGASRVALSLLSANAQIDTMIVDRILQGLCLQNKNRKAIQLYNKLDKDKISLSYCSFHALFQATLKEKAFNVVRKLYRDAKRSGHSLNQITVSLVISGLLRDKRKGTSSSTLAYEIWTDAKTSNMAFDDALFRAGCGACVAVRKIKEAEELIPIMRQRGFRPDGRFYNILLKGYCRVNDMKSAINCFEKMRNEDVQMSRYTYNTLIHGFVLIKDLEKAEKMLRYAQSEECSLDVWSYTSLIDGYLQKQNFQRAHELYKEFKSTGKKSNEVIHSVFINAYIEQGNLYLAHRQVDLMKEEGVKPNLIIYNTLLKGYSSQKGSFSSFSYSKVIPILSEMKQNGIQPGVDTFNTLLSGLMDSQNHDAAKELLQEMFRLGLEPDGVSYTHLMKIPGENFQKIFQDMENSEDLEVDLVCWNLLVSLFAKYGSLTKAEKALQAVVEFSQKHNQVVPVEAFGAIIEGYLGIGRLPKAIEKFRWFCQLGGQPDSQMIEALLKACITQGDVQHALKLLRASQFLDKEIDLEKYRKLVLRMEERNVKQSEQSGSETLKFWLGMPNKHYSSEWP